MSRFTRSLLSATFAALSLCLAVPSASATPDKAAAAVKQAAAKPGADKAKKDTAKKEDADKAKKADAKKGKAAKKDDAKDAKKDDAKDAKDAKKPGAKASKKDDAKDPKKGDASAKSDAKDDAKNAKDDAKNAKKSGGKASKKDDAKDAKKDDGKDAVDVKGTASIGAPNKGRLQGAVKLKSSRSLKVREHAQAWALPALVKLLQRAAGKVAKHHARSVMLVGDLSQKGGGALTGHNSHQSGRDADVGFYISNSQGKPAAMKRFVAFDGTGKSAQVAWAQFDDARNWTLVEALLTDKDTAVRYIFVSNPLRARVLAYAKKEKVGKDLLARAESTLMSPRDADVHDDHFHVRIACPETMKGFCIEESGARAGSSPAAAAPAAPAAPAAKTDDAKPAPAAKTDDAKPTAPAAKTDDAKPAAAPAAKPEEPAKPAN